MRYLLVTSIILGLIGCASATKQNGVIKKLSRLNPGESTNVDVLRLLGPPESEHVDSDGDIIFQYRIVRNHGVEAAETTVGFDSETKRVSWINYSDFDQALNVELIRSLYPRAKFVEVPLDLNKTPDYIPADKEFADSDIGISYRWTPYRGVESITWIKPLAKNTKPIQRQSSLSAPEKTN